jgi:hypothetical protein
MLGSMKDYAREALLTTALFGGIGVAVAQAPAPNADKDQAAQPSSRSDQSGTQEPSAKQSQGPGAQSGVLVNGSLAVPGASSDTSTTPAKFSQANDARDKVPIMARGPALDDAQRKLIIDRVLGASSGAPAQAVAAGPAMGLPPSIDMQAWPSDVVRDVPAIRDTKYVKLPDKILVVRPDSRIVIGEIAR